MPLHAYSQTELVLTERKRLERPLMAMIWLSVLIFSLVQWDFFYLLAATLAVAVNAYAAQKGKEVFVHRIFVNLGVLAATGILVLEIVAYGSETLLFAMGHYFILILVCKLFEHKTNRDYVQMLALSMLLTLVPAIICEKLWFAVLLLAYMAIACYTAMVFTIKRGLDKAASAVLAGEKASPGPGAIAWNTIHHWPGRSLWQWMLAIVLMIAAGAAATFIAFPRIPANAGPYHGTSSVSGFSDTVQLGEKKQIYLSKEVLMQVRFAYDAAGAGPGPAHSDGSGLPSASSGGSPLPPSAFYLRGRVFEEYRGNAWMHGRFGGASGQTVSRTGGSLVRSPHEQGTEDGGQALGTFGEDASATEPAGAAAMPDRPARGNLVQDVTVYPAMESATVFASYPATEITPVGTADINSSLESTLRQAIPGQLVHYTAYSWPQPLTAKQREYLDEFEKTPPIAASRWPIGAYPHPGRSFWRGGPPIWRPCADATMYVVPDDVLALARQWCGDLLLARDNDQDHRWRYDHLIADRLAQRLGQRCVYSLDLSDADPDRDGVDDFLFYMKKGHCEYFASALTVMCRAMGVRARLATGFHLDPQAGREQVYLVRGRDAHAWTEIYTPDTGWTIVDATPAWAGRAPQKTFWGGIETFFSDLQYQWYDKVVGFDAGARDRLFNRIPKALAAIRNSIVNFVAYGGVDAVFILCVAVVGAAGLTVEAICIRRLVRQTRRQRRRMRTAGLVSPAHVRFARLLANLLNAIAPRSSAAATPREILHAAGRACLPGNLHAELADMVELYYNIRWGKLIAGRDQMLAAAGKLRMLKRSIVQH